MGRSPFPTQRERSIHGAVPQCPAGTNQLPAEDAPLGNESPVFASSAVSPTDLGSNHGLATADDEGKFALQAWLEVQDPPRHVPRPAGFFEKVAAAMWDDDVMTPEDLARCDQPGFRGIESPGQRGFVTIAFKAAKRQFGGRDDGISKPVLDESCLETSSDAEFRKHLAFTLLAALLLMQAFTQLAASKKAEPVPVPSLDVHAELERINLASLAEGSKPAGDVTDWLF